MSILLKCIYSEIGSFSVLHSLAKVFDLGIVLIFLGCAGTGAFTTLDVCKFKFKYIGSAIRIFCYCRQMAYWVLILILNDTN